MHAGSSSTRLLIRHFVRRFLDNDLLSAHVDRHESLAFFAATLVAAGTFGAVLLGHKYIFGAPSVSWVAVVAMEDRFVMIAISMIVVALTAAAQWDALSLDARDAAILGPLPIRQGAIVRAKMAANSVFAAALVAGVTLSPAIVFSLFMLSSIPIALRSAIRVVAAHLVATMAAAVFAFLAVVAIRELLRLFAGARAYARISMPIQSVLVVALTTLLLLAVGRPPGVSRTWLMEERAREHVTPFAVPPMWFLGLAEALNGDAIVLMPIRGIVLNDDLSRFYRSRQPLFASLGLVGLAATAGALAVGGGAYAWNSRRLPEPLQRARSRRRRFRESLARLAMRRVRHPVAQAGFFFTLRVLFRSGPQRLAMAVGVAMALSLSIAVVGGAGLEPALDAGSVHLSVWALQPLALIVLLATFRHAMAMPAELSANWVFHQCWPGRLREYLAGVERAALVSVVAPAVLTLMPVHLYVLGARPALFHAVSGIGLGMTLLALLFHAQAVPPFVSSYVRRGNVKSLGPIFAMIVLAVSFSVATVERAASRTTRGVCLHTVVLIAILVAVRLAPARRGAQSAPLAADVPEPTAQTLGLSG